MAVPGQVAAGASADQDVGRLDATLGWHQEVARDFQLATGRDFQSARPASAPQVLQARQHVQEHFRGQPQAARQKAEDFPVLLAESVHWAAQVKQVALPLALQVLPQAGRGESESRQAQPPQAQQVSPQVAPLQVRELAPWEPQGQRRQVQPALPPAQPEPRAHSVSQRPALSLLVAAPQVLRTASSARTSLLLPSLPFPLWRPLPRALLLRPRLESFCAPSPQRPRESSWNASSFPLRRIQARDQ